LSNKAKEADRAGHVKVKLPAMHAKIKQTIVRCLKRFLLYVKLDTYLVCRQAQPDSRQRQHVTNTQELQAARGRLPSVWYSQEKPVSDRLM